MSNVYNNMIEVIQLNNSLIHLYIKDINDFIKVDTSALETNRSMFLMDYEIKNQLLVKHTITADENEFLLYLYVLDNKIYLLKETTKPSTVSSENRYSFHVDNYTKQPTLQQLGLARLQLLNERMEPIYDIEDFFTTEELDDSFEYPLDLDFELGTSRFILISKASYEMYHLVVTYDTLNRCIHISKVLMNTLQEHPELDVALFDRNKLIVHNHYSETPKTINFRRIKKKKPKKLFDLSIASNFKGEHILSILVINKARYYIYLKRKGIYIGKSNIYNVTGHKPRLKVFSGMNNFYIFGRFTHYAHNSDQKYDYLYLRNSEQPIGKFIRPFKNVKILKRYGFFKVPISSLYINEKIHNNFFVGSKDRLLHNLKLKYHDRKVKTLTFRKYKDQLNVIRTNLNGNLTSTIIPYSKEYTLGSRIKISIAKIVSAFNSEQDKNTNLYFEKKSDKADESGFRVFEKVMEAATPNSKNFFILNKDSSHYPYMKKKYGKNVIEKYSFRHYLSIFNADYFISSELSNHLLNDRLYIDSLRNKIMEVPLVFLQHGIMFAKPVDNPMAFGFHKDKNLYNMYKSVISSELEAGEFYKMKYDREDLILTGLATFDYAKLEPDADKIAFMPTYRYWEEGLIYNNKIEETSYYKTIMKVIKSFEKEGLLNRLLIVPHNKFSQFIYNNMPEYKHIISDNPSEALKVSNVFITDYSSAIYDAQFRGAYPIFYWEEKDYLIRQYKAIPPVNDENAPGPVAYSIEDLMETVKQAIEDNYVLEDQYVNNYKKINHYDDRQNTLRIVQFLKKDQII
jgi:CDP-glycerol glycerophosphotransferase (TagB/SpsB family)